jgi:hypothetical protein
VFIYRSASHQVSEQDSYRWYPAASRVDNDLRRWGGSKLTAVNRVVSQTLALSPGLQPVFPVPIIAAPVQDGVYDYRLTLQ